MWIQRIQRQLKTGLVGKEVAAEFYRKLGYKVTEDLEKSVLVRAVKPREEIIIRPETELIARGRVTAPEISPKALKQLGERMKAILGSIQNKIKNGESVYHGDTSGREPE